MKAISIRQPWAWLIVNGYKDIENRSWNTKYRGEVLIHASSRKPTKAEVQIAREILEKSHGWEAALRLPESEHFDLGGIVGVSVIAYTITESQSPWFFGPVGFKMERSRRLMFRPLKGKLSFFETGVRPHGTFSLVVPDEYRDATEGTL